MTPDKAEDAVILLMVSGLTGQALAEVATGKLGIDPADVGDAIARARRRLTLAAQFNRDEEIGKAYVRLNDLYSRSLKGGDAKTALAAQRELNRLLDLTPRGKPAALEPATGESEADDELRAVAAHLMPLELAPAFHPLREHARAAAERILDEGSR